MGKKSYSVFGMIIGILIAILGVLVISGSLGGDTSYASSAPYSYDSGYATFGAEFYTFVSNNAGEAASASRTAANNLDDIAELLKNALGIFLIGFGLMGFCFFGISFSEAKAALLKTSEVAAPAECDNETPAPAEEEVSE